MAGKVGDSSQRQRAPGLLQRVGQGMRKQRNIVRHTADKLDAKALDDSRGQARSCEGRTSTMPRAFIESDHQETTHQAQHPC
jgi:hypothetical protein